MTAVAAPPNIHSRPWSSGQHGLDSMNSEYTQHSRGKPQRWSSSASTPSGTENSGVNGWTNSLGGGAKKKGPTRLSGSSGGGTLGNGLGGWPKAETGFVRASAGSNASAASQAINGVGNRSNSALSSQQHLTNGRQSQQNGGSLPQTYLMLLPLNGTFDRKQIPLPYFPETLRIGRQTNAKTLPSPTNGYFDSKVLSRQHAEVWAEKGTGKVWIRDIKSSNGTFVNGQRLSPENQDSDAQELKADDILELGIDIVGEDNKTIVHHKVAAKVEHAGVPGQYDQLSFGDVDGLVNGSFGAPPSAPQNNVRGRAGPAGPRSAGPSPAVPIAHRQIMMPSITMEMIVKKLNTELQSAKQQSKDLQRTQEFFDVILATASVKSLSDSLDEKDGSPIAQEPPQTNGSAAVSSKSAGFMLPPAHPITGLSVLDAAETDSGPESVKSNKSSKSDKLDPPHQLLSLVDALAQAKKEMELKSSRVHDLEEALKKERKAREEAEDRAAQLEIASRTTNDDSGELDNPNPDHDSDSADNDHWADDASITESETETIVGSVDSMISSTDVEAITKAAAEAALLHQKRMEAMMQELQQAKEKMEQFRIRAEKAETERDADRKTLAEMIQSLRKDEEERRRRSSSHSSQTDEAGTQAAAVQVALSSDEARLTKSNGTTVGPQQEYKKSNGALSVTPKALKAAERESALLVPRSDSAPYMTMFAVMFVGLGLMAAVNNWPRPDTR